MIFTSRARYAESKAARDYFAVHPDIEEVQEEDDVTGYAHLRGKWRWMALDGVLWVLTGCPLRCLYGHNPESSREPAAIRRSWPTRSKLAPTDRPDIGYAMIFAGMTIIKILFVDIVPAFFR